MEGIAENASDKSHDCGQTGVDRVAPPGRKGAGAGRSAPPPAPDGHRPPLQRANSPQGRAALIANPHRWVETGPGGRTIELKDWHLPHLYQRGGDLVLVPRNLAASTATPAAAPGSYFAKSASSWCGTISRASCRRSMSLRARSSQAGAAAASPRSDQAAGTPPELPATGTSPLLYSDSCQPSWHASAGMTLGTPSCTTLNSVPHETGFKVTVTWMTPGRFGSSKRSV